jgi:protein-tyrosine kinase
MEPLEKALERARREREASPASSTDREQQSGIADPDTPTSDTQPRIIQPNAKAFARNRVITYVADEAVVAAYKVLRTRVLQRMTANDWKTLAITSTAPGEGKTLTSINLAISLARALTHTVVLVDLDLRRPRLHEYFDYRPEYGICDHLLDDVPLSEILFSPQVDGLVVLPGREPVANSSELLSSPKMMRLIEELKTRYPSHIVLFDLPPLFAADDVLAFSPHVDAVLLVIKEGKTPKDQLTRSMELLRASNILGTILNKSSETGSPYY